MSEINVTPLVDVMLVLLIVFMVAAPLMTVGRADRPAQDRGQAAATASIEPITITVQPDGTLFLQETAIPLDELPPKLQAIAKARLRRADLRACRHQRPLWPRSWR